MKLPGHRRQWAIGFALLGVVLMGVDLLVTRNFFVHVAELMIPSLFCFVLALVIDRGAPPPGSGTGR